MFLHHWARLKKSVYYKGGIFRTLYLMTTKLSKCNKKDTFNLCLESTHNNTRFMARFERYQNLNAAEMQQEECLAWAPSSFTVLATVFVLDATIFIYCTKVTALLKVCPFLDCPTRSYLESWQMHSSDLSNIENFWPIPPIYYEAVVLSGPSQVSGAASHPLSWARRTLRSPQSPTISPDMTHISPDGTFADLQACRYDYCGVRL